MERLIVVRNFISGELLGMTRTNLPEIHIDGRGGTFGERLFGEIFNGMGLHRKYEYIILMDEDCILTDESAIGGITAYMDSEGVDIMGVPDGGAVPVRSHRPDVPNTFFTVIRTAKFSYDPDELARYAVPEGESGDGWAYDTIEPYYRWLCYMVHVAGMRFVPLGAHPIGDGYTVDVEFGGRVFARHTWFARAYGRAPWHTERIRRAIAEAVESRKDTNVSRDM